ncbi:hypothetical protein [Pseudalkalibacillus caeni]|uniref:Uncharacterized protein n=1 Tax=Exobacillus caeni TaxID=2574798 RepID=A0A5R9F0V4_9BACL|nr:hypothetical protein [Pseudalkalibacillus caeni]TLS37262.1 hypothetical protein FCL54_12120 [Pseudalkalibacillus caeni]
MLVTFYEYKIKPEQRNVFEEVQEKANILYEKHDAGKTLHFENLQQEGTWLEILINSPAEKADGMQNDPEVNAQWDVFKSCLAEEEISEREYRLLSGDFEPAGEFMKLYRFHVPPQNLERYFEINANTAHIYNYYIDSKTVHLQCKSNPTEIVQLQFYKDYEAYEKAMESVNNEPEITLLWDQFTSILEPAQNKIEEKNYQQQQFTNES